jgi:two-component system alkaline phosphatase synthesis response regulator PhoP
MVTARVEDSDKIVGLELGADDYVTKPFNPRELVARVRAVLRRSQGEIAAPRLIRAGELLIDLDRHEVQLAGRTVEVTPTEFSLLQALAEHAGHPLTRLDLIERGFGYAYEGLERTVDSHVKNLRRKLAEASGPDGAAMIETVFGVGYRLRAGEAGEGGES